MISHAPIITGLTCLSIVKYTVGMIGSLLKFIRVLWMAITGRHGCSVEVYDSFDDMAAGHKTRVKV